MTNFQCVPSLADSAMNNKERCEAKWRRRSLCISSIFDAQENRETIDKHESSRPNRLAESANLTSNCQKLKIAGVAELFLFFLLSSRWNPRLLGPRPRRLASLKLTPQPAARHLPAGATRATLAKPVAELNAALQAPPAPLARPPCFHSSP